ncbi:MAG: glycosyltransferase family 4 protein [Desulfosarcinaceae bacterium]|nr:glycosyltransferase family 4 protein [Desulfosarcinaceae bacterium]
MLPADQRPLRICLLSYRSNPHCGGQGVYVRHLSRALTDLGHRVTVLAGPPSLQLDPDVAVVPIPGLDLYNPADPFRVPSLRELSDPVNLLEWLGVSTMGFPEPFTFGIRSLRWVRRHRGDFDIVHDNQSLSYGVRSMRRLLPTTATIHHPITVDRDIAVRAVKPLWKKAKHLRWYSFIGMQKRVAPSLSRVITVSACARDDIAREFRIPAERFRIAPNGVDTCIFRPLPGVARESGRLIVTNSSDTPLKGLYYLLHALTLLPAAKPVRLVVVGTPKKKGGILRLIRRLGIGERVTFTGRISDREFVRQYARASLAVVPSVYEGFGLPAGEAMACGVPVISTSGGALPEVVGEAGILVPPRSAEALAAAITTLTENPGRAAALGDAGYRRVQAHFTWQRAAQKTVAAYREVIDDYHRFPPR